jgi:hypothetical protein
VIRALLLVLGVEAISAGCYSQWVMVSRMVGVTTQADLSFLMKCFFTAYSLAHGAGRRHPRQALHNLDSKTSKSSLTKTSLGSEVICTDPDLLLEERPEAYKDVGCVVDDMEEKQICRGVVVLRPVVTYKVRENAEGRK